MARLSSLAHLKPPANNHKLSSHCLLQKLRCCCTTTPPHLTRNVQPLLWNVSKSPTVAAAAASLPLFDWVLVCVAFSRLRVPAAIAIAIPQQQPALPVSRFDCLSVCLLTSRVPNPEKPRFGEPLPRQGIPSRARRPRRLQLTPRRKHKHRLLPLPDLQPPRTITRHSAPCPAPPRQKCLCPSPCLLQGQ
jgi:hypothetical protein